MRPFAYRRAASATDAIREYRHAANGSVIQLPDQSSQYLAGGTTLLDLMKLDVLRPAVVIPLPRLDPRSRTIELSSSGLRLGSQVTMAEAAAHEGIRTFYPVIAQSLQLAASPQIRNMATLGGNVLQRTRCTYFRDTSWTACNKRVPGSGCSAIVGFNRQHAVLGTSEHCIATYPGDFAQALIALDASVELMGTRRSAVPFVSLHVRPGSTPFKETTLIPGEMITAFDVPFGPWAERSLYAKVRDRASYEFALASAAVTLHLEAGIVRRVGIALGGVATVPWRAHAAEEELMGRQLDESMAARAAAVAFQEAQALDHNAFKVDLGKALLASTLLRAREMKPAHG